MLPQISPSPLTSLKEPIGHPNWIFELKHDGFRGILYIDRDQAWLVSRKRKKFHQFNPLLKQVLRSLKGQRAILDGEIVVLDEKGRSNFHDLWPAVASLAIMLSVWSGSTGGTCAAPRFWSASGDCAG